MASTTLLTRPDLLDWSDMLEQRAVPCGIGIPQSFVDGRIDTDLIREFVRRAEDLGYHSLWTGESILGGSESLEPISLLSYVASLTESIRLGTAVVIATNRNPVQLAKAFGTLDQLSGGRLIVGMAIGGDPSRYPLFGAPSERRVRHFIECLEVMKALWQQHRASYDGRFYTLDGETMEPKPVQKPHPPIWFGGRHPDALRRAVRHGDGWMGAGGTSTEQFSAHVEIVRESLAASGRDPASFAIAKRVYLAIDDDADRAERRLREWFGLTYGSQDMGSRVSVWGSISRCIEGVTEVMDAGAQMLLLNPVFDEMEHLEALHDEVIPNLPRP